MQSIIDRALRNFIALTGCPPTDEQMSEIRAEVARQMAELRLPAAELARVPRPFAEHMPRAYAWRESTLKMLAKLRKDGPVEDSPSGCLRLFDKPEPRAYNFDDDQEIEARWDGADFRDTDGAAVIFCQNQWAYGTDSNKRRY